MSRKNRKHHARIENQNLQESDTGMDIAGTAKETVDSAMNTINNNKLLIGSIAVACGAAVYLLATESGRRVRTEIQDRVMDLYDSVSDQMVDSFDRVRSMISDIVSSKSAELEEGANRIKRVA